MIKKITVILLSCLTLFLLIGCSTDEEGKKLQYETITSFETYEDIQSFQWSNRFGRAQVNKDAEFITEGAASMQIQPYGDFENDIMPVVTIDLASANINKQDFSKYEYLAVDVYNASDRTVPVSMILTTQASDGEVLNLPGVAETLKAKAWTTLYYNFSDGSFAYAHDMKNIFSLKLQFPQYRNNFEEYIPDTLYFDNMYVKVSDSIPSYQPVRTEKEIVSFENISDMNLFSSSEGVILKHEGRESYVSQGILSLSVKGKGFVMLDEKVLDKSKIANGNGIAVDILNVRSGTNFSLVLGFNGENGETELTKSVFCYQNEWTTVSLSKEELGENALSNLTYIKIVSESEQCYFDDIRIL